MSEIIICKVCKRNIKEIPGAFPVWDKKLNSLVCSHCSFLQIEHEMHGINKELLSKLPKEVKEYVKVAQ